MHLGHRREPGKEFAVFSGMVCTRLNLTLDLLPDVAHNLRGILLLCDRSHGPELPAAARLEMIEGLARRSLKKLSAAPRSWGKAKPV